MIDRVVQRPFLFWQAERMVNAELAPASRPLPDDEDLGPPPSAEEIELAKHAVAEALAREREQPLTWAPTARNRSRIGEVPLPIEWRSYFPRDPALSLVQSAVERYLMEFSKAGQVTRIRSGGRDRAEVTGAAVADFRLELADDQIPPEDAGKDRLGRAKEVTDPRWVSSVVAWGWRLLKGYEPAPLEPAPPHRLADDARLVVVGDWASGNHRCRCVAAAMRPYVEDALARDLECHVLHLGDTYYAGWGWEYRKNFLAHWPVKEDEAAEVGSWSLAGNHDMQTGGQGYYDVLLEDSRFKPYQGGSSRFSLENDHWQLLGLDSARHGGTLEADQVDWVEGRLGEAREKQSRTMLLTHHQPFSAYNHGGGDLRGALKGPIERQEIDAWLWGHEHRLAIYESGDIKAPLLIGHGGVPSYTPGPKPPQVVWHLDRSFREGLESWAYCGFAVLDLAGPRISVSYVNEFGETDRQEVI